jgi:hypothetical protein
MELVLYRWGGLLVLAIVVVGVLNDQNQFHADTKADAVIEQGRELGRKLSNFTEKFPKGPPDESAANAKAREQYKRDLEDLQARARKLSSMSS